MIEVIKKLNCENGNTVFGFNSENVYYSITVNKNGDYWMQVSGHYSFMNGGLGNILKYVKSLGVDLRDNITAEKYFANKR